MTLSPERPRPTRRLLRRWRRLRSAVLARRRALAALLAGLATLTALQAHAAPPPTMTPVLVAARDLPAGWRVRAADLAVVGFVPASVPDGTLARSAAEGRTTVGPVRAGEALTDARLLDAGLLARYPGSVATAVRIGDGATTRVLRVGDHVSVLAAEPQGTGPAELVVSRAPVLALPQARRAEPALTSGALVVLAVDPLTARELAGVAARSFLSVVLVG